MNKNGKKLSSTRRQKIYKMNGSDVNKQNGIEVYERNEVFSMRT